MRQDDWDGPEMDIYEMNEIPRLYYPDRWDADPDEPQEGEEDVSDD